MTAPAFDPARLGAMPLSDLFDALEAKQPVPGGGAAAGVVGALSASLARMVLSYTEGSKKYAPHEAEHAEAARSLGAARAHALELARADAEAYGALNALWKLDRSDPRYAREMPEAARGAIEAPLGLMESCVELLALFERLAGITNRMLRSDLAMAAVFAESVVRASAWNVRINTPLLEGAPEAEAYEARASVALEDAARLMEAVQAACR